MLLTKLKFYILLQLLGITAFFLYQGIWLISDTTEGQVINFGQQPSTIYGKKSHESSGTIAVRYIVDGTTYEEDYTRNRTPLWQQTVRIRYLLFAPSISNRDTFINQWEAPLIVLLIFFMASSMLLLIHNTVFPRGTLFELSRRYPYIQMHEFFPHESQWQQQRHFWKKPTIKTDLIAKTYKDHC